MKKRFTILLIMAFGYLGVNAQQDAQFALFPWAGIYYNAGAAGEQSNTICFTGIFRQQYTGFKDVYYDANGQLNEDNTSPQQIMVNLESYLRKIRGGVGLSIIKDKVGYFENIGVKLGYAYKLRIPTGSIGIGLQASFLNQKLDASMLRPGEEGDEVLNSLGSEENSFMDFDLNFGLFYKAERWYAGLSATQLISNIRLSGDKDVLSMARHLYISGGYRWAIPSNPSWELEPQALIKTDFKTAQLDLMVLGRYNGIFWGGFSYRIDDAVSLLFGARPFYNNSNNYLKGIDVGLAYSFTTSKLGYKPDRSYGDFEIMIRYCFDIYKEEVFSGYGSTRNIYKNQY